MKILTRLKHRIRQHIPARHAVGSRWRAVSDLWGGRAADLVSGAKPSSWAEHPLVNQLYIHQLVSGNPAIGWLESIARRYFPAPVAHALSLGCGGGGLERHALSMNMAHRFDAYDISDGALELARRLAAEHDLAARITYQVADLNAMTLPANHYDAVFASQSVHHIESLEHYLDQVVRALKPGQLFVVNEFLGPNQFQWTDAQLKHSQNLLDKLPEKYRMRIRGFGTKRKVERPTIETMIAVDPTEAIRSQDILPEMQKRFEIIEKIDFGGTLLHLVLDDIAGNFTDTPEDRQWLQMLFDEEQALLRAGEITSDFALIVARKPDHSDAALP
jgi:ubiquinone/menaquinone biosynthesis C-methylase UbiE